MKPSHDPSIENEPHLQGRSVAPDPTDRPLGMNAIAPTFSKYSEEDIDHSVFDEPALSSELSGPTDADSLTYANWLEERKSGWSQGRAWVTAILVALLAGPWGLLGSLIGQMGSSAVDFFVACLIVPVCQEIFKIAIPLWIVEKRPYVFTGWFQLFLCAICSATFFASVHNLVLQVADPGMSQGMFIQQWTGFLLMHLVASTLAAIGLEKIWRRSLATGRPPKLEHGFNWFVMAIGLNVAYTTCFAIVRIVWQAAEMMSLQAVL